MASQVGEERRQARVFVLTLRSFRDDGATTRALRAVLKALLRRHGLQCVDLKEIGEGV
jgi:hypothetical protein